jgi:hypothetical protein
MRIILPKAKAYLPGAGACIYCCRRPPDAPRLTREHIIPFGLRGQLIFHKASCDDCAAIINSQIETPVLGHLVSARTTLEFNKPKRRPLKLRYGRWKGERNVLPDDMEKAEFEWKEMYARNMPLRLILPEFATPGIITSAVPTDTFEVRGIQAYNDLNNIPEEASGEAHGQLEPFSPDRFCRMIAKVAHGAAMAELKPGSFKPFLPDVILGKNKMISYYVGSTTKRLGKAANYQHEIELSIINGLLIADVRLFADLGYRPYHAVVGIPSPELSRWHLSSNNRALTEVA